MYTAALILLAILAVIAIMVMFLLISPVHLIIDSPQHYVHLGWNRWMHADLSETSGHWFVGVNIPFWHRRYPLMELILSRPKTTKATKKKPTKNRRFFNRHRVPFRRILAQIKIRKFRMLLDTDDYIRNAYLVPVCMGFNRLSGHHLDINFMGRNEIQLHAETKIAKLLIALWR